MGENFEADVMTVEEFIRFVDYGCFTDFDGVGNFCKDGRESDMPVRCDSNWLRNTANKHGFTHVAWYNN